MACECGPTHVTGCPVLRREYYELANKLLPLLVKVYERVRLSHTEHLLRRLQALQSIQRAPAKAEDLGWDIRDKSDGANDRRESGGYDYEVGVMLVEVGSMIRSRFPINVVELSKLRDYVEECERTITELKIE